MACEQNHPLIFKEMLETLKAPCTFLSEVINITKNVALKDLLVTRQYSSNEEAGSYTLRIKRNTDNCSPRHSLPRTLCRIRTFIDLVHFCNVPCGKTIVQL